VRAADCILQLVAIAECDEGKERYRMNRTGTGGCWALLFFTTYAMHHVSAMSVMLSNTINCILKPINIGVVPVEALSI
jgi:hypothetical protein